MFTRRIKRDARRELHRYPTTGPEHRYLARMPEAVWRTAWYRARAEDRSMRVVIVALLEAYGKGLVNVPEEEPAERR